MQQHEPRRSSASSKQKAAATTLFQNRSGQTKPRKSGRRRVPSNASTTASSRSGHSNESSTHASSDSLFSSAILSDTSGERQQSNQSTSQKQHGRNRPQLLASLSVGDLSQEYDSMGNYHSHSDSSRRRQSGSESVQRSFSGRRSSESIGGGSSDSKDSQLRRSLEAEAWKGIGDLLNDAELNDTETVTTEDINPDAILRSLAKKDGVFDKHSEEDSYVGPRQQTSRTKQPGQPNKMAQRIEDDDENSFDDEESDGSFYESDDDDENDSQDQAMKKLCGFLEPNEQTAAPGQMPNLMDASFSSIQTDITDAKSILSHVKGNQVVQPTTATGGQENAAINDFLTGITSALQRKQGTRNSIAPNRKEAQKLAKQPQQQRRPSQAQNPKTKAARAASPKGKVNEWTAASGSPPPSSGRVSMIKKNRNESPTSHAETTQSGEDKGKAKRIKKKSNGPSSDTISHNNLRWSLPPTFPPDDPADALNSSLPSLASYTEDDAQKIAFARSSSEKNLSFGNGDFVVASPSVPEKSPLPQQQRAHKGPTRRNSTPSIQRKGEATKKGPPKPQSTNRQSNKQSKDRNQRRGSANSAGPAARKLSGKPSQSKRVVQGNKKMRRRSEQGGGKNPTVAQQTEEHHNVNMAVAPTSEIPNFLPVLQSKPIPKPPGTPQNPDQAFDNFFPSEPCSDEHTFGGPSESVEATSTRYKSLKARANSIGRSKKKQEERNEEKFFPDFHPESEQHGGLLFN